MHTQKNLSFYLFSIRNMLVCVHVIVGEEKYGTEKSEKKKSKLARMAKSE